MKAAGERGAEEREEKRGGEPEKLGFLGCGGKSGSPVWWGSEERAVWREGGGVSIEVPCRGGVGG